MPPRSRVSGRQSQINTDVYVVKRGNFGRVYGKAQSNLGEVQLKVDPSEFLNPMKSQPNFSQYSLVKLVEDVQDFIRTKKGCVIHITLEYFDRKGSNIQDYAEVLMRYSMHSEFFGEQVTLNFFLITSLKSHGEKIKRSVFSLLYLIMDDTFIEEEDWIFLKDMSQETMLNFANFVGLLYFRFRKDLVTQERFDKLAPVNLFVLRLLVEEGAFDEIRMATKLVCLNYTALHEWSIHHPEFSAESTASLDLVLRTRIIEHREDYCIWLLGLDYLMNKKPNEGVSRTTNNFYTEYIGPGWIQLVSRQILADIHFFIAENCMDKFNILIDEYDSYKFLRIA